MQQTASGAVSRPSHLLRQLLHRIATLILITIFAALSIGSVIAGERPTKGSVPNIVLILADDLGWSDTTLYGTTKFYQTPNIERLARRGMVFTRAYSASPLCSPTRASILTGQNPARIGITSPVCHTKQVLMKATVPASGPPANKAVICKSATRFDTEYYTLAEAMKDAGYATGHFGKWHLGPEPHDPLHHGFDIDVPHWPGPGPAGSFVAPWRFPDFKERVPHEHIEDRMGDEAVAFIEEHRAQPFYLNYWQFSVHAPFDAKASLIEKHRARVDPNDPQRSPTYAAMVESLDDNVGKMLDTLDRLKLTDRTIVIFYSDNGGNMYNEVDGTTPTSNTPLRGGKATMYEGGVRVPCIVAWPGTVKAGRSDVMIQSTDLYPTLLDALEREPKPGQIFDGISIVPTLRGQADEASPDRAIFTFFPHAPRVPDHMPPAVSVHQGDWKLIRIFYEGENGLHAYELYNLREDIGETRNLASSQPQRVRELDALIESFLKETAAVVPIPNPNYQEQIGGLSAMTDCRLKLADGLLHVTSTGGDPHFQWVPNKPLPAGPLKVELRMKSSAKGSAQLFWHQKGVRPAYFRDRSTVFRPTHDGQYHTYQIILPTEGEAHSLRLDPAQGPGEIVIETLRVTDRNGEPLGNWLAPVAP